MTLDTLGQTVEYMRAEDEGEPRGSWHQDRSFQQLVPGLRPLSHGSWLMPHDLVRLTHEALLLAHGLERQALDPWRQALDPWPVVPGLVPQPLDPVAPVQSRAPLAQGPVRQRREAL